MPPGLFCTDQWVGYNKLNAECRTNTLTTPSTNTLSSAVHTQTIEGFWPLAKRGMVGTFHKVSEKYLPRYVAEFQFRYNNRENENIFAEAIWGC
jgi:hypothetical protein